MQLTFLREGYAHNSSSSHSLIWTSKFASIEGKDCGYGDFGWSHFTCCRLEDKMHYIYLIVQRSWHLTGEDRTPDGVLRNLSKDDPEIIEAFFSKWLEQKCPRLLDFHKRNVRPKQFNHFDSGFGHIDHQSIWSLPSYRDVKKGCNAEFAQAVVDAFLDDNYIVLGGNDNDEVHHPLVDFNEEENNVLSAIFRMSGGMAEYDTKTSEWVISRRGRGIARLKL